MRHRFVCPLYNKHPKHQEVIDHLHQFTNNDRGRELALLAVAGYQAIYGRDPSVTPQSIQPDLTDFINQLAAIHQGSGNIPHRQPENSGGSPTSEPLVDANNGTPETTKAVNDDKNQSKLGVTKDKNNELPRNEESGRALAPPKSSVEPADGLLDEPPESNDSDTIVDPLTSIGKLFN